MDGWPGWVGQGGWLCTEMVYLPAIYPHPSSNRVWCRATALIETCAYTKPNYHPGSGVVNLILISSSEVNCVMYWNACAMHCYLMSFSLSQLSSTQGLAASWTKTFHSLLSLVLLSSCPSDTPVYDRILLIQEVLGLPRLLVPGIVPWIGSFSRQFPFFLSLSGDV